MEARTNRLFEERRLRVRFHLLGFTGLDGDFQSEKGFATEESLDLIPASDIEAIAFKLGELETLRGRRMAGKAAAANNDKSDRVEYSPVGEPSGSPSPYQPDQPTSTSE